MAWLRYIDIATFEPRKKTCRWERYNAASRRVDDYETIMLNGITDSFQFEDGPAVAVPIRQLQLSLTVRLHQINKQQ